MSLERDIDQLDNNPLIEKGEGEIYYHKVTLGITDGDLAGIVEKIKDVILMSNDSKVALAPYCKEHSLTEKASAIRGFIESKGSEFDIRLVSCSDSNQVFAALI